MMLISRTKLVEQQRDTVSSWLVETLKLKIMKLRKENEILRRQLPCSEDGLRDGSFDKQVDVEILQSRLVCDCKSFMQFCRLQWFGFVTLEAEIGCDHHGGSRVFLNNAKLIMGVMWISIHCSL
ncbi:protein at-4/1 [Quercus suber]|uniref:Protein at-4/1 n=1 Tax=Quercus suber TaxID=58331 RepID=A0AAW0II67_QUESU